MIHKMTVYLMWTKLGEKETIQHLELAINTSSEAEKLVNNCFNKTSLAKHIPGPERTCLIISSIIASSDHHEANHSFIMGRKKNISGSLCSLHNMIICYKFKISHSRRLWQLKQHHVTVSHSNKSFRIILMLLYSYRREFYFHAIYVTWVSEYDLLRGVCIALQQHVTHRQPCRLNFNLCDLQSFMMDR